VIVARQYSFITRIKVDGINIKAFTLEVPLQVIYPPPQSAEPVAVAEEQDTSGMSGREVDFRSSVATNEILNLENVRTYSTSHFSVSAITRSWLNESAHRIQTKVSQDIRDQASQDLNRIQTPSREPIYERWAF
jgi:hypothetical protein